MAVYAIGDLQGCFQALERLLDKLNFNPECDQLWFAGDLVNRGPDSLQTLRFIRSLGDCAVTVLGNHDLHLLSIALGVRAQNSAFQSLDPILNAPDKSKLIDWLLQQPLLHRDKKLHTVMVHAGLHPSWKIKQAAGYAAEVESKLQGRHPERLLKAMYGNKPNRWEANLKGDDRLRFIINVFTRMRYCSKNGALDFQHTGPPNQNKEHCMPWYQLPSHPRKNWRVVFGHWSSAGHWFNGNYIALDSGCLWGGELTAARIDERLISITQINCVKQA